MATSPYINHFIQPDTIIPEQSQGVQAWDRYAYTNSNPLRYTDPTGHGICQAILGFLGVSYLCQDSLDGGDLIEIFDPVKEDDSGLIIDPPIDDQNNVEGFDIVIETKWGEGYGPYSPGDAGIETFDPVPGNTLDDLVSTAKKPDIKWMDWIQIKYGLSDDQREWLHQQLKANGLTKEEIEQEAADIQRLNELRRKHDDEG